MMTKKEAIRWLKNLAEDYEDEARECAMKRELVTRTPELAITTAKGLREAAATFNQKEEE